jgi:hypothetical protein
MWGRDRAARRVSTSRESFSISGPEAGVVKIVEGAGGAEFCRAVAVEAVGKLVKVVA